MLAELFIWQDEWRDRHLRLEVRSDAVAALTLLLRMRTTCTGMGIIARGTPHHRAARSHDVTAHPTRCQRNRGRHLPVRGTLQQLRHPTSDAESSEGRGAEARRVLRPKHEGAPLQGAHQEGTIRGLTEDIANGASTVAVPSALGPLFSRMRSGRPAVARRPRGLTPALARRSPRRMRTVARSWDGKDACDPCAAAGACSARGSAHIAQRVLQGPLRQLGRPFLARPAEGKSRPRTACHECR